MMRRTLFIAFVLMLSVGEARAAAPQDIASVLAQMTPSSATYWDAWEAIPANPDVSVNITLEASNLEQFKRDLEKWMPDHGATGACQNSWHWSTTRPAGTISSCSYVLKAHFIHEASDWIKDQAVERLKYEFKNNHDEAATQRIKDKLRDIENEIAANKNNWKSMPGAAAYLGLLWSNLERVRLAQVKNAESAVLVVEIFPAVKTGKAN